MSVDTLKRFPRIYTVLCRKQMQSIIVRIGFRCHFLFDSRFFPSL